MDSYFSGDISKEDMQAMKKRYENQLDVLQQRLEQAAERKQCGNEIQQMRDTIQSQVAALLRLDTESEAFCKTVLDHLTVFPDRHIELRLNDLPQIFRFAG